MIQLTGSIINIKLATPLAISFHTWHYRENVHVFLQYKDVIGIGEAAPFKPITGDSQEEVIEQVKRFPSLPLDPTKDSLEKLHVFLQKQDTTATFKAAVDFAYHDLLGKLQHIPVYKLYSQKPHFMNNSVTVFIKDTVEETAAEAKRIMQCYPQLKIMKIKLKGEQDIERAHAIKQATPDYLQFVIDANQGFHDPVKAVTTLNQIGDILGNVILIEEPCPKGELDKMKYIKDHVKDMFVFADESAATVADAKAVIAANAAHGINIKLQKAGGIWQGKQIAALCHQANYKIMVGSMLDGPIATMASVHFAVSTQDVILSDLDMDLDMPNYVLGQAKFEEGKRAVTETPGLGVTINEDQLQTLAKEKQVIYNSILP